MTRVTQLRWLETALWMTGVLSWLHESQPLENDIIYPKELPFNIEHCSNQPQCSNPGNRGVIIFLLVL